MDEIEKKATEIADNILKAIEPFLSEIKKKNERIKELEEGIEKILDLPKVGFGEDKTIVYFTNTFYKELKKLVEKK